MPLGPTQSPAEVIGSTIQDQIDAAAAALNYTNRFQPAPPSPAHASADLDWQETISRISGVGR